MHGLVCERLHRQAQHPGAGVQAPLLAILASFLVFTLAGGAMTAAIAFPALGLFAVFRNAFAPATEYSQGLISAWVAQKRMLQYLQACPPTLLSIALRLPWVKLCLGRRTAARGSGCARVCSDPGAAGCVHCSHAVPLACCPAAGPACAQGDVCAQRAAVDMASTSPGGCSQPGWLPPLGRRAQRSACGTGRGVRASPAAAGCTVRAASHSRACYLLRLERRCCKPDAGSYTPHPSHTRQAPPAICVPAASFARSTGAAPP